MTLQTKIEKVLEENASLKSQVQGFKTLTEQLLQNSSNLQQQIMGIAEQQISNLELEIIAQGQMQTDIELAQLEQAQKLAELETAIGADKDA